MNKCYRNPYVPGFRIAPAGPPGLGSLYLKIVDRAAGFGLPVGDVYTLEDNVTYLVLKTVDLEGKRIVCGTNNAIHGYSSENCRIKSTGLTDPLITSEYSLSLQNITIEALHALDLDAAGNPNQALDWTGVNFTDCAVVGSIKNYNNFIFLIGSLLNSANMTFDGSVGTIGFAQCLFDGRAGQTTIIVPSTATITRRMRISYCSFVALSGETGLNVDTGASVPVEGHILDSVNFSGGGTYTAGITFDDNKALWQNCRGINNSGAVSYYTMVGNATATTIATVSTPVKVAGTTTSSSVTQKFSHTANKATYTGALTRSFKVTVMCSLTSGNNHQIGIFVAKNGTVITESQTHSTTSGAGRSENVVSQCVINLVTSDYIEVWTENATTSTDITVTELSVIVEPLN